MVVASLIVFGEMAGSMSGGAVAATLFSLIGRFVIAAGFLRIGLAETENPTLRAGTLLGAAVLVALSLK
jgi:hypothetical protein